jgi:Phage tail tube protein
LYKGIKTREMYDFGISYAPVALDNFFKSMVNLSGTGNRDDFYTIFLSQQQNVTGTLTEQYQVARGCGISSITISVKNGELVMIDSDWIANDIAAWVTTSPFTTPTYASAITAVPWSAVNAGAFTFNGVAYDVRNFSVKIDHNPDRVQVVGQSATTWIQQTTREISIDVDIVYKDTTLQADTKSLTARAATFVLNTVGPTTLTFTDMYLESYDETVSADSTDAKTVSYSGYAASVSIA